jgi:putative membrane protein
MLWVKAFHIVFVVSWYAALLYLPRLFVYHAQTNDEPGLERFEIMERKLYVMMTIGAVGTVGLGAWLVIAWPSVFLYAGWLHAKLVLVAGLIVYHIICGALIKAFAQRANTRSHTFYRLFNEVPALALIAIAILVVVKPF